MKTIDEMIAVMQAAKEGKQIEWKYLYSKCWNRTGLNIEWNWSCHDYRIKPEPKRVPLGPEDIDLHRDLFRLNQQGRGERSTAHSVTAGIGIWIAGASVAQSWNDLMEFWEISSDGGKTWRPCWKEEA